MALSKEIQEKISRLYLLKKLSVKQIADQLKFSPSGITYYLNKNNIPRRSISDAINSIYNTKFNKPHFEVRSCLSKEELELKIAGIMLYWGEGAKGHGSVDFSNSNPEMIITFLRFLREICGISESRMKAIIHIYPDHNKEYVESFWSNITKIPRENFYTSHLHLGKRGTYKNKSEYGTIAVRYSDKLLLKQILDWIEEYKLKFAGSRRKE